MNHSERPRECCNCLRSSVPDVIPETVFGEVRVRAFEVCTWCGWVWEETHSMKLTRRRFIGTDSKGRICE